LSGRGLCDELITRPEESYRLCCVVMCDLETSRIGAPYIYDISNLSVNALTVSMMVQSKYNVDITSHILSVITKHNHIYLFIIIIIYVTKWTCE